MEGSEFVDEWRRRRLCALVFGIWKNNIERGYDIEDDNNKMKAQQYNLNNKKCSFFNRIEDRLACYARSYNNMIYVKYFVMLISYRKGLNYWLEFIKYKHRIKAYTRVSNEIISKSSNAIDIYPSNNCKRLLTIWRSNSRKHLYSQYIKNINKSIKIYIKKKQIKCFDAFVENYNQCLIQSQNDTKGRVYYLENLFMRLIYNLRIGYKRNKREKINIEKSYIYKKQRESRIVFVNLGRICCESIARIRIGNLLRIRYEESILRKGLLCFIWNYSYRIDVKVYNRTYVHSCMLLYKKGVGMKLWKLFVKRLVNA